MQLIRLVRLAAQRTCSQSNRVKSSLAFCPSRCKTFVVFQLVCWAYPSSALSSGGISEYMHHSYWLGGLRGNMTSTAHWKRMG